MRMVGTVTKVILKKGVQIGLVPNVRVGQKVLLWRKRLMWNVLSGAMM